MDTLVTDERQRYSIRMTDVTRILTQIEAGETQAAEQLLPLVYDELRQLAAKRMSQEAAGHTLDATALVHEAYIRLVDVKQDAPRWDSRGHFFAAAAEAMRRILVEQARRRSGPKAGGRHQRIDLTHVEPEITTGQPWDLLGLNEALERLESIDPRAATLVKLRFFAGLTRQQAAEALQISIATADNDWAYARSWLQVELADSSQEKS